MTGFRLSGAGSCAVILTLAAHLAAPCPAKSAEPDSAIAGEGKFILHKFEQPIGEESYRIVRRGDSLTVGIAFAFTDRGSRVPLTATFRCGPDLTPQEYGITGKTSRQSTIDDSLAVVGDSIRIRNRQTWSVRALPSGFFTITGYAPVTMQMLMVRYWSGHGSPASLPTFPGGQVRVEARGLDTIISGGMESVLRRFTVEGLIWGRETLWFDKDLNLAAVVTTDAEFDHFEAVQEQYVSALGKFVGRAGADGMAALADLSKGISGRRDPVTALVGGTLVDGTGAPPVEDAAVIVDHGVITSCGPRRDVKIPPSARIVDVKGRTILPGLWDMHAHVEQVEWGPIYLAAGVTTVRDCGNEFEFITAVRDAIAGGRGLGPRILAAGIVDGSGKYAIGVERVDTPEEARTWTDRYHDAGFQQMKIYSSVKLEALRAVAGEAHRMGMTVTGHVPIGLNAYQVVEAGQDQINHFSNILGILVPPIPPSASKFAWMDSVTALDLNSPGILKAIEFFRDHHTVIDPTLALTEISAMSTAKPPESFEPGAGKVAPELARQFLNVGPPSEYSARLDRMLRKELEILGAFHRGGVTIVAGTDQAVPGHSLHREMELYVEAGFTPMEAIQAATIVPARVMGLAKKLGTIEPGKRGDLVIVRGNPLSDIRQLRNVETVMTEGVMYETAPLWRSVGFTP